jgi:ubiquinol-cytochrome c reductase cytochrome c1 subunit
MSAHILPRLFAAAALMVPVMAGPALSAEDTPPLKKEEWSFDGPLGTFDRPALQRGFQVYKEVCSSCHTLQYIDFRNLGDRGGPGFSIAEVKAIAAAYQKDVLDDTGETKQVPRTPADGFPDPFPNEQIARAGNGGALPPDLSLINHAREGGPDYIYSLVTGYTDPPTGVEMRPGMNYNSYFPTHQIAMPFQLPEGRVTYADGTPATSDQMAKDVVTFLEWAADPKMEERKRLGLDVMVFLAALSVLLFWSYRKLWHDKH